MNRSTDDSMWNSIHCETRKIAEAEPLLASFLHATILNHSTLENALSFILANKLASSTLLSISLMELISISFSGDTDLGKSTRADLQAIKDRDPACRNFCTPLLHFKGFHALQSYRVAHLLWNQGREAMAMTVHSRIAEVFDVDIHPAARLGCGILMDHATGIVIGETAVVEDDVSILHNVTLGGTGKDKGDRHPKIGRGVLISTGASILGNVHIGDGAKIGANSVVLNNIPPHSTAVGVPAKVVGHPHSPTPALEMNHKVDTNSQ